MVLKKLLLFCFVLVGIGCKTDSKKQTAASNKNAAIDTVSVKLDTYKYEQLAPLLNKQNDTIYIINFWATWCAPCVKELPYFERINKNYKNSNVKVVLVSLDFPKQVETKLKPFIKKRNIQSKVIYFNDPDENSWIPKIDNNWSGAIPATIIYDKNRRKFYEQSFTFEELETELKTFLN